MREEQYIQNFSQKTRRKETIWEIQE